MHCLPIRSAVLSVGTGAALSALSSLHRVQLGVDVGASVATVSHHGSTQTINVQCLDGAGDAVTGLLAADITAAFSSAPPPGWSLGESSVEGNIARVNVGVACVQPSTVRIRLAVTDAVLTVVLEVRLQVCRQDPVSLLIVTRRSRIVIECR